MIMVFQVFEKNQIFHHGTTSSFIKIAIMVTPQQFWY